MKRKKYSRNSLFTISALTIASALTLTACGSDDPVAAAKDSNPLAKPPLAAHQISGTMTGIGASSQKSAVDTWVSAFQQMEPNVKVQYSSDGSGAGRTALIQGAAQFAGTDAYLKDTEIYQSKAKCGPEGAINIPVYISPIEVTFNLDGIKTLNLDASTIAKIFSEKITNWNDPAIKALNPGVNLPNLDITPVHRGDESGTTQNFTDYLSKVAPQDWPDKADQKWPNQYKGEAAQKTAGVVATVESTPGAITYADESGVSEDLGRTKLKVGDTFQAVTPEAAANVVNASPKVSGRIPTDIAIQIDRKTTAANSYPLVLVSYHAVCTTYKDPETVELVKAWETFVVSEQGQKLSYEATGSAPLPAELRTLANKSINSIKEGN
ncbi:MAG: phosphate ABC transporter substrate-binding protein PstS [Micrococcaceae bacterium]